MRSACEKICMKFLLMVFVGLISLFWIAASQAKDHSENDTSREVLARLDLDKKVTANVDTILAQYEVKLAEQRELLRKAQSAQFDAIGRSEDLKKAAKEKYDKEDQRFKNITRERNAKIKQALPPALAAKYERGMKLIEERTIKHVQILDDIAMDKIDVQKAKQKDQYLYKEYGKKLDAEVGRLKKKQ